VQNKGTKWVTVIFDLENFLHFLSQKITVTQKKKVLSTPFSEAKTVNKYHHYSVIVQHITKIIIHHL
jgi:hypothetical protein